MSHPLKRRPRRKSSRRRRKKHRLPRRRSSHLSLLGAISLIGPIRLIVGLGNPGREYEQTRHNIGFMILDELATRAGAEFRHEGGWNADVAVAGPARLCKPQSFMNVSGEPVGAMSRFYKIAAGEMIIVLDDAALPLGRLRFRAGGSSGGHNGLQSIIDHLRTDKIPRLRAGIGAATSSMTGHVLGRFSAEEVPFVTQTITRAVDALLFAQTHGLRRAMDEFNPPTKTES